MPAYVTVEEANTYFSSRLHLHPRGVAFQNAVVVGSTPSNAELANPQNWKRVYEPKNVRIVQFKHRVA